MRLALQLQWLILLYQKGYHLILIKNRFKKVLDLARNTSKGYKPPNISLIAKDILDVIHDQNMKRNLRIIHKGAYIFWGSHFLVMVIQYI